MCPPRPSSQPSRPTPAAAAVALFHFQAPLPAFLPMWLETEQDPSGACSHFVKAALTAPSLSLTEPPKQGPVAF